MTRARLTRARLTRARLTRARLTSPTRSRMRGKRPLPRWRKGIKISTAAGSRATTSLRTPRATSWTTKKSRRRLGSTDRPTRATWPNPRSTTPLRNPSMARRVGRSLRPTLESQRISRSRQANKLIASTSRRRHPLRACSPFRRTCLSRGTMQALPRTPHRPYRLARTQKPLAKTCGPSLPRGSRSRPQRLTNRPAKNTPAKQRPTKNQSPKNQSPKNQSPKNRLTKNRLTKNRLTKNRLTKNRLTKNRLTKNRLTRLQSPARPSRPRTR
ncbi:hypothetical protein [Posidoniimonas polymericola]|uniref:hypothetical protein n=1 Tax=Posidoniimonas polymericola TaxID=2528002 RepID=UPI003703BFD0